MPRTSSATIRASGSVELSNGHVWLGARGKDVTSQVDLATGPLASSQMLSRRRSLTV
jgi:hypothetical protein